MLQHYEQQPSDPEWVARVGEFHGHLGPWVVLGTMIGRDALERLDTRGYWDIEVTVWLPPDRQRQPWSCVLDGLQVGTGATLGKQNIRLAYSPDVVRQARAVVHVLVRNRSGTTGPRGFSYRVNDRLHGMVESMKPDRLEDLSRELARMSVPELFEVQPL